MRQISLILARFSSRMCGGTRSIFDTTMMKGILSVRHNDMCSLVMCDTPILAPTRTSA